MPPVSEYDVIVVGFGAAGAAAAIEAADRGARVLVLDRGYGGGATALSGGIVYAGGGTQEQADGGYTDTVDDLKAYLKQEVGDAVSEETLDRFCEQSPNLITWLKDQDVEFRGGTVSTYKTSYPTDDYYLYYSGNEKAHPYVNHAKPAPRGHRVVAPGMSSGKVLFERLRTSAEAKGVHFLPLARVHGLIQDGNRVVGVRYRAMDPGHRNARPHRILTRATGKVGTWMPRVVSPVVAATERLWDRGASERQALAPTVVLAAGGFIYNREWVSAHAPAFTTISPLGTAGDDGAGIALGLSAGGTVSKMGNVTAWRFLAPPSAFLEGLTVGIDGRRIANEDLYGATHGNVMMRQFGGSGWAIYDARTWTKVRQQIGDQTQLFQRLQLIYLLTIGHEGPFDRNAGPEERDRPSRVAPNRRRLQRLLGRRNRRSRSQTAGSVPTDGGGAVLLDRHIRRVVDVLPRSGPHPGWVEDRRTHRRGRPPRRRYRGGPVRRGPHRGGHLLQQLRQRTIPVRLHLQRQTRRRTCSHQIASTPRRPWPHRHDMTLGDHLATTTSTIEPWGV